jgi:hypothetical protein
MNTDLHGNALADTPETARLAARAERIADRAAEIAAAEASAAKWAEKAAATSDLSDRRTWEAKAEGFAREARRLAKPFGVAPITAQEIAACRSIEAAFPAEWLVEVKIAATGGGFFLDWSLGRFQSTAKSTADIEAAKAAIGELAAKDAAAVRERIVAEINTNRDWHWQNSGRSLPRPQSEVTDEEVAAWTNR